MRRPSTNLWQPSKGPDEHRWSNRTSLTEVPRFGRNSANWLADHGNLPAETRDYVLTITRHPVEEWIGDAAAATITDGAISSKPSCLQATAAIRRSEPRSVAASALFAPWGVQLAGSFSKAGAGRLHPRPAQLFRYYWQDRTHGHRRSRAQPRLRSILASTRTCALPRGS